MRALSAVPDASGIVSDLEDGFASAPRADAPAGDVARRAARATRVRGAWAALLAIGGAWAALLAIGLLAAVAAVPHDAWSDALGALQGAAFGPDGALWVRMLLLAAATLISEDATCVATGLLVAQGRIGFVAGTLACFTGILIGDLLLFAAGRTLGRRALATPLLRRILTAHAVERASTWLERSGAVVILLSRLTPGMRLPTYFAAGVLRTRALVFAGWFALAAALWTPALVALAQRSGAGLDAATGATSWLAVVATGLVLLGALRALPPLLTHRGRRLALGRWRRLRHWEFWPLQVLYVPIVLHVARLAVKYRSLTLPSAVNPAIPGGGFAGESKVAILEALARVAPERSLQTLGLSCTLPLAERIARADAFVARAGLGYPVVFKPDVGERGSGVVFAASRDELHAAIAASHADGIVQELAPGVELGIFYVRHPDEEHGRIFSITEKILPSVTGDGRRTIEQLILDDERAVCMARTHLARFAARRDEVLPAGARLQLVEVGTHSRGAIFRDGARLWTPALADAIDDLSRRYQGFFFGRYDVRVPTLAELQAGRGFKIVELNGLTAEATHVYHPGTPLRAAYRVLFEQWRLAFAIAHANRERGARPATLRELARMIRRARRRR